MNGEGENSFEPKQRVMMSFCKSSNLGQLFYEKYTDKLGKILLFELIGVISISLISSLNVDGHSLEVVQFEIISALYGLSTFNFPSRNRYFPY